MEFVFVAVGLLIFMQNYTPGVHAAPPIQTEACPPDSILSADVCKCVPGGCPQKPPCPWTLVLMTNGTDVAGDCCPTYKCTGCPAEKALAGDVCPCATGAQFDATGQRCICTDKGKHLVNGECVCDPQSCQLPQLCDKKSVAITTLEGCCKKTVCKQCPIDSESTNLEVEELEDHCICLPCKTHCGTNESVIVKKKGIGFPGNCCDLYECQKVDTTKGCLIGGRFYNDGEEWSTTDLQICKCNNGLSLCSKLKDLAKPCYMDNKLYKDQESWTKEDGCTACTCRNGVEQCISHFCDAKESHIHKSNDSRACVKDGHAYAHLEHWLEKDGCTNCTCTNGVANCTDNAMCERSSNAISECQPLAGCDKTCLNGFKINKRGCEICKCNAVKFAQDILGKYNISMSDLIGILEEYKNRRIVMTTPTTTTSTTSSGTMASAALPDVVDVSTSVAATGRDDTMAVATSTTTRPFAIPTGKGADSWIFISLAVIAFACFMIGTGLVCVYKSKRKSSIDLTHCHYETVNSLNNNNTIKKTDQLL